MIREERLDKIEEYVNDKQYASVDELVALLGVSKATVRRDITFLCGTNRLTASWGGVLSLSAGERVELFYKEKKDAYVREKQAIGKAAAQLIRPGMSLIIDAGTTTRALIPHLRGIRNLNVATNDLMIAVDLALYEQVSVTVTGGQIRQNYYTLRGYAAEESIRNLRADIAFLGFDMLDPASGCYITNADEVAMKKCMIDSARQVVVLCDHSKFEASAFLCVCPIDRVHTIITDAQTPRSVQEELRQNNIEVIQAL